MSFLLSTQSTRFPHPFPPLIDPLFYRTSMLRQPLLPTDYHCQSSIRVYRSRLSLLLLPLSIVILFVVFSSYNSDELETIREMRKQDGPIGIARREEGESTETPVVNEENEVVSEIEDEKRLEKNNYDEIMESGRDVMEKEEELGATFESLLEFPFPDMTLNGTVSSSDNSTLTQLSNSTLIDSIISIDRSNISDIVSVIPFAPSDDSFVRKPFNDSRSQTNIIVTEE